MKEKSRCSILFHLLVPGGKWHTDITQCGLIANFCNSNFHSRSRQPLLPPPSAVIRIVLASDKFFCPRHATAANRGHGKRASVVVRSNIDKTGIASNVVDAIGIGTRNFRAGKS